MGECWYYLRAAFPERVPKKIFNEFVKLLEEHIKCEREWQCIRNDARSVEERLKILKEKFPDAMRSIEKFYIINHNDLYMNFLAGLLFHGKEDWRIWIDDNEIRLKAYLRHWTTLTPLCHWLILRGAESNWINEEMLNDDETAVIENDDRFFDAITPAGWRECLIDSRFVYHLIKSPLWDKIPLREKANILAKELMRR